jgi:hypothetical protein
MLKGSRAAEFTHMVIDTADATNRLLADGVIGAAPQVAFIHI